MTFKANEIEQYPYLVYTDDAGNIYDPNGGGGGGGEVTDESLTMITLSKTPVSLPTSMLMTDDAMIMPVLDAPASWSIPIDVSQLSYALPVPADWYLLISVILEDMESAEFEIDENTVVTAQDKAGNPVEISSQLIEISSGGSSTYYYAIKAPEITEEQEMCVVAFENQA